MRGINWTIVLGVALLISTNTAWSDPGDKRIWIDATINGKAARLVFDTGAEDLFLWRPSVSRLNLKSVPGGSDKAPPTKGNSAYFDFTEPCTVSMFGTEKQASFNVEDLVPGADPEGDGSVGWPNLRNHILQIDAEAGRILFLEKVPKAALKWSRFAIATNTGTLRLLLPSSGSSRDAIDFDTGSPFGLELPAKEWKAWKLAHEGQGRTMIGYFQPGPGTIAREQAWSDHFEIGNLRLKDLEVTQASSEPDRSLATLGMEAIKRMDLIADGKHGVAYVRPKSDSARPGQHNRAGVVFMPPDTRNERFFAFVAQGSPADEAGIRSGDELLGWNSTDFPPGQRELLKAFHLRAGTKITMKLRRDGNAYSATVTLRDILIPPQAARPGGREVER